MTNDDIMVLVDEVISTKKNDRMDESKPLNNITKNNVSSEKSSNIVVNVSNNILQETRSSIFCENCGSHSIHILNDTMGVCEHCGAKILLKKQPSVSGVKVNIFNGNNTKVASPYFVLKNNYSEVEFKRKAIINLVEKLKDSSVDILKSKFGDVYTRNTQYMICSVHIDGSYSASIGYDRTEKYVDYQERWNSTLKRCVKSPVTMERKVIDWKPYSESISSDQIVAIKIKGESNHDLNEIVSTLNFDVDAINLTDSDLNVDFASPSASASQEVVSKAMNNVRSDFPGDHVKDIHSNFSHYITETKYCIVTEYVMPYWYDEHEYEVSSFATRLSFKNTLPPFENEKNTVIDDTIRESRPFEIISVLLSLLSIGLAIALPIFFMNGLGVILGILSMTPSIWGYFYYKKKWKNNYEKSYRAMIKRKQNKYSEKLNLLESYLRNNSMPLLSSEEKKLFNVGERYAEM